MKCWMLTVVKCDVYGQWDEMVVESRGRESRGMLVNGVFVGWLFICRTVSKMHIECQRKFQTATRETSHVVMRTLVKDGGPSGSKYMISSNPRLPVLLISNNAKVDKNNEVEVAKEKAMAWEKKVGPIRHYA